MFQNASNNTLVVAVYPWAVQGIFILDNIVSRSLGGIGILVNLFFVIILSHRTLRHKIYDFLWCRQFTSFQKTTFLRRISKKWNLFICFSFSFIICVPAILAIYVVKVPLNGKFKLTLNVFGVSIYYKLYLFVTFLIEIVIPLITLLWINSVSIFKFKRVMERHGDLTGNQIKARKAERRFTRMVFFLSVITLVTRIIDMVTSIFIRISVISPSTFDRGTLELIIFSKSITVVLINIALAFDALVFLRMDKNIWALILSYRGRINRVISNYY